MSLTNALSAISIVGSLLLAGGGETTMATVLGSVAVFASFTNIVSGFLLTDRMLGMFRRRQAPRREPNDATREGASS
jgi:NAD(P) transhydrogenase subunit alpha